MSFGPDFHAMFAKAGGIVDQVLRGKKPAEFRSSCRRAKQLTFNPHLARTLGVRIPKRTRRRAKSSANGTTCFEELASRGMWGEDHRKEAAVTRFPVSRCQLRPAEWLAPAGIPYVPGRCGGGAADLAGRRPRSAAGQGANDRLPRHDHADNLERERRRISEAAARTRLDRWPQRRHRISLGGRDAMIATPSLRPSLLSERSISSSRRAPRRSSPSRRQLRRSRSSLPQPETRCGPGWSVSLSRPGGNVTGLSNLQTDLGGAQTRVVA